MREILRDLNTWKGEGKKVTVATVAKVYGSAPRPLGSKLATSSGGEVVGSVSGGCIEGAVIEEARTVMETGQAKLVKFGITDEQAWTVGLSCGGEIEVFLEPTASELYDELQRCIQEEQSVASCTVIAGASLGRKMLVLPDGQTFGDLGSERLNWEAAQAAEGLLKQQKIKRVMVDLEGQQTELFVEVFPPPEKLIIVGAVHVAIPLITFAKKLGFRTVVVDPRSVFATPERFSEADELIVEWPHEALSDSDFNESTYCVVLSHDEKLDNPALRIALENGCRYIGALGSRKTQARRQKALKELGITDEQLASIHAPIGIDLGGRRAEEIAISIIAEIVAVRNSVSVKPGGS